MAKYRDMLPWDQAGMFLVYVGLETDLIFNKGVDLPGFASYPLLNDTRGRALLWNSYQEQIALAKQAGVGLQIDTATWMANRDRAAEIGVTREQVLQANRGAVHIVAEARKEFGDVPTLIGGSVGTRTDAYAAKDRMSVEEAATYHAEQIGVLAETDMDVVSAMTLPNAEEAAGIALASMRIGVPVEISFTVETDGHLSTGMSIGEAIAFVDDATDGYPEHYMINCAHPDHFTHALGDYPWMARMRGIVANASRFSHAELDEAEELDDGNPAELGKQLNSLKQRYPQIRMLGGCCGTDMRHMRAVVAG